MSKRTILISVLLTMMVSLVSVPAGAGDVVIDTSGASPFVYEGRTYLPLQNAANFLGATTRWDSEKRQSVMTYDGQDLAFVPGKTSAWFNNEPVELSSRPVVIDGRTYVPLDSIRRYYDVPMEWHGDRSEVRIWGRDGWGTAKVEKHAPWHGGPPPWAPAWGQRNKQAASYHHGEYRDNDGVWKQTSNSKQHKSAVKRSTNQGKSDQKGHKKVN